MKFAKNLVLTAALVVAGMITVVGGRLCFTTGVGVNVPWLVTAPPRGGAAPSIDVAFDPLGLVAVTLGSSCAVHRCRGAAHPGRPGLTRHAGDEGERGSAPGTVRPRCCSWPPGGRGSTRSPEPWGPAGRRRCCWQRCWPW